MSGGEKERARVRSGATDPYRCGEEERGGWGEIRQALKNPPEKWGGLALAEGGKVGAAVITRGYNLLFSLFGGRGRGGPRCGERVEEADRR